jgi:hypothetical protein
MSLNPKSELRPAGGTEEFFNQLVEQNGYSMLEKLIESDEFEENESREFKEAAWLNAPIPKNRDEVKERRDRDDALKSIWSEAIGAFANSGGGLLIFGIGAPHRVAKTGSLARDPDALANRLIELANDAVEPTALGIRVEPIKDASGGAGFVACYIPRSNFAPHGSRWAEREYYIRSQDGNIRCPTAVLRRLFYPLTSPLVVPFVLGAMNRGSPQNFVTQIQVILVNHGTSSARDAYVQVRTNFNSPPQYVYDNQRWEDVRGRDGDFVARTAIHPEQRFPFLNNVYANFGDNFQQETLSLDFSIFAADATPVRSRVTFTREELLLTLGEGNTVNREAAVLSN